MSSKNFTIRIDQSKMARGYLEMKKAFKEAGREEDAESVTAYCLADNLEEATAAYPTNEDGTLKIVLLKQCHPENARIVDYSNNKKKMEELCRRLKDEKNS